MESISEEVKAKSRGRKETRNNMKELGLLTLLSSLNEHIRPLFSVEMHHVSI